MLRILAAASVALGLAVAPTAVSAQAWPDKPVRIIVPFAPGGGTDITARLAAEYLSGKLGQSVVVENKPGAATAIGMELVAKSKPDGYTLLWTTSDGMSILPAVKADLGYKIPSDFSWVAGAAKYSLIVTASAKAPFKTLAEMIKYGKANPGKIRYSSSGVGAGGHLATELIARAAGVDMVHVPYQGAAPAATAAAGGHVDLVLVAPSSVKPHIDAGNLVALATTDTERNKLFPNVPTLEEAGLKGINVVLYYGMLAPAGTPEPILERLRKEMDGMLKDPKIVDRINNGLGFNVSFLPGEKFKDYMVNDLAKWTKVAKDANISIKD